MFHHGVYLEFWHFKNHSLLNWSQPIVGLNICLFKIQNLVYMYFCNCNSVEFNKNIDTDASVKICCDWLDFFLLIFMVIALQEKLIVLHQGKWQSVGLSLAKDLLSVRRHLKIAQFSFFTFLRFFTSFSEVIRKCQLLGPTCMKFDIAWSALISFPRTLWNIRHSFLVTKRPATS